MNIKKINISRWATYIQENIHVFRDKEHNYIDHQRQIIMIFYTMIISAGILSNLLRISGSFTPFFTLTNSIFLGVIILLFIGYLTQKLDIIKTVSLMTLSTQFFISIDTIYSALVPSLSNNVMVILINMLILSANTIVSLACYLIRTTQVMTFMTFASYIACTLITNDNALKDYLFILLLILIFITIIGFRIAKNAKRLEYENQTLKEDEAELLHILRLDKMQVKAYIKLAKEEHSSEQTSHLLDLLGETSQRNLIANITEFMRQKETENDKIAMTLPELTESEREICQLILRNKKLGEICTILNKTESNITTQRGNIRRKLGLHPTDNLQKALMLRMK